MKFEVEQKFPVSDLPALEARLIALGASISEPVVEVDVYYAHPVRDFAKTDEALRIRRRAGASLITYKGPKIDATTKTRREIELPLAPTEGSAAAWAGLLKTLSFTEIAEVRKSRRKADLPWQGRRVEVSLDEVPRLGSFVELELLAESDEIEAAKACVASLAAALGLKDSQRRSYLELLLDL